MKSLQGYLLIASPKLLDPNFDHSVVLIVRHDEENALGFVLNRPLDTTIDMVWEQVSEETCKSEAQLFQGGPCEGTLMVVHGDDSLSASRVIDGVYFSTDKHSVEKLVTGDCTQPMKFFVGYSSWGPGQLEGEMEAGAWLTYPAKADHVFATPEDLWNILRRRIILSATYPDLPPERIPDDPTVN